MTIPDANVDGDAEAARRAADAAKQARLSDLADEAEQARRSDLCAALALEAATMMDLAEAAGYALRVTMEVFDGPVAFVFH